MSIFSRSPFDGSGARCIENYMDEHNNSGSRPSLIPAAAEKNAADQGLVIATGTDLTDRPTLVLCATSATRSAILKLSAPDRLTLTVNLHDFWRAAGTLTLIT